MNWFSSAAQQGDAVTPATRPAGGGCSTARNSHMTVIKTRRRLRIPTSTGGASAARPRPAVWQHSWWSKAPWLIASTSPPQQLAHRLIRSWHDPVLQWAPITAIRQFKWNKAVFLFFQHINVERISYTERRRTCAYNLAQNMLSSAPLTMLVTL